MSATSGSEVENQERSLAYDVFTYIALAFGFSWVLTIGAIKLGLSEEYLNIGTAGPAVAALILSRRRQPERVRPSVRRWSWFIALLVLCWIVLCLHYAWWGGNGSPARFSAWLLIPALLPAWILSSAFSANEGVGILMRRLLHPPGRWSVYALLFFPVFLGIPSAIAYVLGAKLAWPELGGFGLAATANAAMFFFYNLLFVGTQEEPGWRGFLLDRLQNKFSPLSASLLTWLPWALWHAPLDYYRPVRFTLVQEILLRVVFLIPLTSHFDLVLQPFRSVNPGHGDLACFHEYLSLCVGLLSAFLARCLRLRCVCSDCGSDVAPLGSAPAIGDARRYATKVKQIVTCPSS